MRKSILIALLAAAAMALLPGCGDDENLVPYFARTEAEPECGVAPLEVQFLAYATGGDMADDPTGANNYIDIDWDFGDGQTGFGSVIFHVYDTPGEYEVVVRAKDKDGDASRPDTLHVVVRDRFMNLVTTPDTTVTAGDEVAFGLNAELCGFDPLESSYSRFSYLWEMDDEDGTVYTERFPVHVYPVEEVGTHVVKITVEDLQTSFVERDSLTVEVTAPAPVK